MKTKLPDKQKLGIRSFFCRFPILAEAPGLICIFAHGHAKTPTTYLVGVFLAGALWAEVISPYGLRHLPMDFPTG